MAFDPCRHRRRYPPGYLENTFMATAQVTHQDRFVMGDPVVQDSQVVRRESGLLALQFPAMRKRPARRRPPWRHLVVRLNPDASRPPGPASETQKPNDRAATTRNASSPWPAHPNPALAPVARSRAPLSRPAAGSSCHAGSYRRASPRCAALRRAISSPAEAVEGRADGGVPDMEPRRLGPVASSRGEAGAQALARERHLELVENLARVEKALDLRLTIHHVAFVHPGPASAFSVCARGCALSVPRSIRFLARPRTVSACAWVERSPGEPPFPPPPLRETPVRAPAGVRPSREDHRVRRLPAVAEPSLHALGQPARVRIDRWARRLPRPTGNGAALLTKLRRFD